MVVVLVGDELEAGAAVLEVVLGDQPRFLEQVEGAVDRRQGDARVDGAGPAVELLDVGMIDRLLDDLRDDPALVGHAHALFGALLLEGQDIRLAQDRKSTRLNSSHVKISYAVFCLKKKKSTR